MPPKCNTLFLVVTLNLGLTGVISAAFAEDNSDIGQAKPAVDVKKVFATNCSWCHDGYGMDAGKGPKLAGHHNERRANTSAHPEWQIRWGAARLQESAFTGTGECTGDLHKGTPGKLERLIL